MKWLAALIVFLIFNNVLSSQVGKVGINTTTPAAMLHVKDSSVVFTGNTTLPVSPGGPPVNGAGIRMMWYPDKAAFRAGYLGSTSSDFWNKSNVGDGSIAMGLNTKATGQGCLALGDGAKATLHYAAAFGNATTSSGLASFSMGQASVASGTYATAMGYASIASGLGSVAMGYGAMATGNYSTAMGGFTFANGIGAVSMGMENGAKCYAGTVVGVFNDTISTGSATGIVPTNRLFQIGNGTAYNVRSNAMTVLQNGKVGINITTPAALLHVKDSSVVFTGNATLPVSPGGPPVNGAGIRMMWYPDKAAFRAGYLGSTSSDFWNKSNVGDGSIAMGLNTKATGQGCVAIGDGAKATLHYAAAFGNATTSSGLASFSMGQASVASGTYATAMGYASIASGLGSVAMGYGAMATGNYSTAMGGFTFANGIGAVSMGMENGAKCYAGTVVGVFNDTISTGSATGIVPTNRLFQIGNGTAYNVRSNALTVLQNGNIGIGTTSPGFLLNFPSSLGDKISLWGFSGNHYGFGVQQALLQIHTDVSGSDIAFGYGSSNSFTENMRIKGSGNVGIGTNNPSLLFQVAKNTNYSIGSSYGIAATNASNANLRLNLGYDSGIDAAVIQASQEGNTFNKSLLINPNAGNVCIGSSSAVSKFQVSNGAVLFEGTVGSVPVSGAGVRMMWVPDKKAIRAGEVSGGQWNTDSIGLWSVAMGQNCAAKQSYSLAIGSGVRATGIYSSAFGRNTKASGSYSTSFGWNTVATGDQAIATGLFTTASGVDGSFASGNSSQALGASSSAFNNGTEASGHNSAAFGYFTKARSYCGTAVGCFNDDNDYSGFGVLNDYTRVFQVGNGIAYNNRHNALTVLYSGKVGIGMTNPEYLLDVGDRIRVRAGTSGSAGIWFNNDANTFTNGFIGNYSDEYIGLYGGNGAGWAVYMNTINGNVGIGTGPSEKFHVAGNGLFNGTVTASCGVLVCSDIRYKKNILPIHNALSSLQSIHGIYYHWDLEKCSDKGFGEERQIGFSAQELELQYPEMVHTDSQGYKTVDYSKLTPVLVEAIKEQQNMITDQKQIIEKQQTILQELQNQLSALQQEIVSIKDKLTGIR